MAFAGGTERGRRFASLPRALMKDEREKNIALYHLG
jgi:hypothetical protein